MDEFIHTYIDKNGDIVSVTEQHLEVAVEIKIQLQEASPSRRVAWNKHKKLMQEQGYNDSCTSESYRNLVKFYQKKIGKLTKYNKDSDLQKTHNLEIIQKEIGELYQQKQETHQKVLELNRLKREMSKYGIITEQIRDAFIDNFNIEIPRFMYKPKLNSSSKKAVLVLSDFHIGATVKNIGGNSYNYEIAKKRVDDLIRQTVEHCQNFDITDVKVVCIGDICEQIFMRNVNQAFECEFHFSEQIVRACELIIYILTTLSQQFNCEFAGIGGNHDRMNGQKADNILDDTVMAIVNYVVSLFISTSKIPRLSYMSTDSSHLSYSTIINKSPYKFVHGDNEGKKDRNKLLRHNQMDKKHYKAVIMGHYHHYEVIERDYGALEIYCGSLMGRNNFSKKLKTYTDASQCLIVVDEEGNPLPIRIPLHHIQG